MRVISRVRPKILTILLNCAVAAFAILLITKKDVEDEESND